jgi:hypothetical protein
MRGKHWAPVICAPVLLFAGTIEAQPAELPPADATQAPPPPEPAEVPSADAAEQPALPPPGPGGAEEPTAPAESAPPPGRDEPLPESGEGAPPPEIYLAQPLPLPPPPRTRHYHEGFYLRMTLGAGYLWARSSVDSSAGNVDANIRGAGMMFDLGIGGSPQPGLVVGGNLMVQESFDPRVRVRPPDGFPAEEFARDGGLGFVMLGPMIDVFPDPDGGFHVGGTLGAAVLDLDAENASAAGGLGMGAWAGYTFWVSAQWSLGLTYRFNMAHTARELSVGDTSESIRSMSLGFTAIYN